MWLRAHRHAAAKLHTYMTTLNEHKHILIHKAIDNKPVFGILVL